MPRALKFTLMGCGGLLGLLILFVACAAIIGGNQETATESPPGEAPAKEEEEPSSPKEEKKGEKKKAKDEGQTVGVRQRIEVGDIEWTVTNARQANQLSQEDFGQFGDTKQGNFVVVDVAFKNNGSQSTTLTSNSLALLDSNNRESEPDTDTFGYVGPQKDILLEQVNPGVLKEGTVIFTVSPDAADFRLRLGDANVFSSQTGYVDLGF